MFSDVIVDDFNAFQDAIKSDKRGFAWVEANRGHIEIWKKRAMGGDSRAQVLYGFCLLSEAGTESEATEANSCFASVTEQRNSHLHAIMRKIALDSSYPECLSQLSWGRGVNRGKCEEALNCFRLAAEQGNALAQFSLGWFYLRGPGVREYREDGLKWLGFAAEQGHEDARKEIDTYQKYEVLTAKSVRDMVNRKNSLSWDDMWSFRSINADAAKAICKYLDMEEFSTICLNGVREISADIIEILNEKAWSGSKAHWCTHDLDLNGLSDLSVDVAKALSKRFVGIPKYMHPAHVSLDGIKTLGIEQARYLKRCRCSLSLDGITALSDEVAEVLFSKKSGRFSLNELRFLQPAAVSCLVKASDKLELSLDGLEEVSPEIIKWLATKRQEFEFNFDCVTTLSIEVAVAFKESITYLLNCDGELEPSDVSIVLGGVASLSLDVASVLASIQGTLSLDGLTNLSDEIIGALATKTGRLSLCGITKLSETAAEMLSKHNGDLLLNGIVALSDKSAKLLAKHKGDLDLEGLTDLSVTGAKHLIKHVGSLNLGDQYFERFAPEVAGILRQHPTLFRTGARS